VATLRPWIGKICHVYLDDIIWSDNLEEHIKNLQIVLETLRSASLFTNPKKCQLFQLEVDFLGHHISVRGIEASSDKVEKILKWPRPQNAKEVRGLLGLVRYVALYLPNLAEHTKRSRPLSLVRSA
jgi:hypothetical protein